MKHSNNKLEWSTPKVERIDLEFDKEMDAPCFGSSNTPIGSTGCSTGVTPSCFSKGGNKP